MKNFQFGIILCFIIWSTVVISIKIYDLSDRVRIQNDNYRLHSKTPCMTLPDNTPCWDKTVFRKLPGGSLQKELRRICAFKSPKAQVWKGE